ncbi:MAG TPA: PilZ domain-containing protein [Terriglobia bacterium]|nr:PilZ domain-containing protein [Terriglobia bacterium]
MAVKAQALKKSRGTEKREHPRFTAQFRSTFSGGQREGQGKTLDLSDGGCRIESDYPVVVNAPFECRIYAPGLSWPLRVDEAQVRWVNGNTFGLQFTLMDPEERVKLRQVIANLNADKRR